MGQLESFVTWFNGILWGPPMMILLVGFGILSTFYLGFPQITKLGTGFKEMWRQIFNKDEKEEGAMSSFQALSTALAAQVGTGNIGGVATAIVSGGPGAVFWMWVTAIFGAATIFVEAILAQKYRERRDGDLVGGPAFYLSKGLAGKGMPGLGKGLAGTFAVLIIFALGFIGNAVQSNSISGVMSEAFGIQPIYLGIVLAVVAALIVIGGMERIASFTEIVVPFMALLYLIGSIIVFVRFSDMIWPTIQSIVSLAFSGQAFIGGLAGYGMRQAIRYGVARGLFSNEAGMGSTPNSHAVASVKHPVIQGTVAMVGVFIDTIVVCTATALVVIVTGAYDSGFAGPAVTMEGFRIAFGDLGAQFLALALLFFAFTTIVGWYYFGENNVKYLFKGKGAIRVYQVLVLAFILLGTVLEVGLVWELADMFNGLMVIPNIIGITFLLSEVKAIEKDYDQQLLDGKDLYYPYTTDLDTTVVEVKPN